MSRRARQNSCVRTEGGLLPQDVLSRIQAGDKDLPGLSPESYHLGPHERIGEAVNRAWSRLTTTWRAFQEVLDKAPDTSRATGLTRDRWLLPLFQELGYGRLPKGQAIDVDGKSFAVSHMWHRSPIHLLGVGVDLDRRQAGVAGAAKASPHGLVQEFLNRSDDHLWGFVSNGLRLRILRDHHSLTRQAYVEFDLQAIMEGEQYSEFLLLWMVCHQSRVEADKPEDCWLETWFNTSRDEGIRALDKLRDGVEKAIEAFGTGFLSNRANTRLREALESGDLDKQEYYRQILRLVYRLIFLFVAEERDALLDPEADEAAKNRYLRYYTTRRLRELADKRRGGPHGDLWQGLRLVMSKFDDGCPELALPALGSRLWGPTACPWLMIAECSNEHLLEAVRRLSNIQEGKTRYPVNWRNVGADELGSIYEGLLELHPRLNKEAGTFELDAAAGHERKTTGSYYTPTELVDCLLDSALDPVLDEACKKPDPEAAILDLKVCDPACGSGHFLVAAARRIAKRLAAIRAGDDEPSPREVNRALRDVVGRCIFGVDVNPMAVELCKVSLWMEAIEPGRPLSFVDSHIQCGNALLGATPALMARGIPDDAFKPIEGDDKDVAKRLKKRNKDEHKKNEGPAPDLFSATVMHRVADINTVVARTKQVEEAADDSIAAVREKERRWDRISRSPEFKDAWFRADAWCAAFVWPKQPGDLENAAITHDTWLRIERDVSAAGPLTRKTVRELARRYRFFHWHLAFPTVFGEVKRDLDEGDTTGWTGGFDVVLGNPPWERIKLQEKEFFASRAPEIAGARNAAARKKAIARLEREDPALWAEWKAALREADGSSHLVRDSGRYPLCGRGDINTFALFAETDRGLVGTPGRVGVVIPTGLLVDVTTRLFFWDLVQRHQIVSAFDFENRKPFFPGVDGRYRFCLLTLTKSEHIRPARFVFVAREMSDLVSPARAIELSAEDIARINPNSRTCPVFVRRRDAEIARWVYGRVPVWRADDEQHPDRWGVALHRMFDMTNDHAFFAVWSPNTEAEGYLPIIEGKMVGQYDHRAADIVIRPDNASRPQQPAPLDLDEHRDPLRRPRPYLAAQAVETRRRVPEGCAADWFIVFKRVTAATNWRTIVACVVPFSAISYTLYLVGVLPRWSQVSHGLLAALNSFCFDFFVRQKTTQPSLPMGVVLESPMLPPSLFNECLAWSQEEGLAAWLRPRVLELNYTAWDLEPFARDHGHEGPPFRWDEARRFLLRCELDAAFFHLYLGTPAEWRESGSAALLDAFPTPRDAVDYILETFPIVKRKDIAEHGDYRTKRQILDIYDRMHRAIDTGEPYQTLLDPPPADPSVAHPESTRPEWAVPRPAPSVLPELPALPPTVTPDRETVFIVWALLRERGQRIGRTDLARAFALRGHPDLLLRLAPAEVREGARDWAARVGTRSVPDGTLVRTLRALADRQGIRLATDDHGRSVVEATGHTPSADQLDAWYRFEARLALIVLDALAPDATGEVDASLHDEDRRLLAVGEV